MKKLYTLIAAAMIFCFAEKASAQTISSKIMDASLHNSELKVFLTDTIGIAGVQVSIGTTPDSFAVYSQQFTISGNTFGSNGTISDNTLRTTIAGLSSNTTYFTRIRILLDNSLYHEIEIQSNN